MTHEDNPGDENVQKDGNHQDTKPLTEAEIEDRVAYIDGVNGSAGHHLDDEYLRGLVRRQVAGEITGDEARELGRRHLGSGRRP